MRRLLALAITLLGTLAIGVAFASLVSPNTWISM
jgi:hypothetical protein